MRGLNRLLAVVVRSWLAWETRRDIDVLCKSKVLRNGCDRLRCGSCGIDRLQQLWLQSADCYRLCHSVPFPRQRHCNGLRPIDSIHSPQEYDRVGVEAALASRSVPKPDTLSRPNELSTGVYCAAYRRLQGTGS